MQDQWETPVGTLLTRQQRKDLYGGGTQRGIEPSSSTPNIFLYSDPSTGANFGYVDDWDPSGEVFLYTGEGARGDQQIRAGNQAILDHKNQGRALRLFIAAGRIEGTSTKTHRYVGEFELASDSPYVVEDAPDIDGNTRRVFRFRLLPVGEIYTGEWHVQAVRPQFPPTEEAETTAIGEEVITPTQSSSVSDQGEIPHDVDWISDAPATVDALGRDYLARVVSMRLKEINASGDRKSFLVHVDGAWGAGKSTLLNFLEDELSEEFCVISFDAWQQSRVGPPWWSLMASVRRGLARSRGWFGALRLRVQEFCARVRRTGAPYYLPALLLLLLAVPSIYLLWPAKASLSDWLNIVRIISAVVPVLVMLLVALITLGRFLLWDSVRGARLFEKSDTNPMEDISAHFSWLTRQSKKPIALFVDDLDRCTGGYVVEFLDIVQTLVRHGVDNDRRRVNGVLIVVAADGEWIRQSYEEVHGDRFSAAMSRSGRSLGYSYLDKLFQLTIPVPKPAASVQARYLDRLLGVASESVEQDAEVREAQAQISGLAGDERGILRFVSGMSRPAREAVAGSVAEALASEESRERTEHQLRQFTELLDGNPRTTKRFLNTYSILRSVRAVEAVFPTVEALALWSIIKVRWPGVADHLEAHPEAIKGVIDPIWCEDNFPEALREAASSEALRNVVCFKSGDPLTPQLIRLCCGGVDQHE